MIETHSLLKEQITNSTHTCFPTGFHDCHHFFLCCLMFGNQQPSFIKGQWKTQTFIEHLSTSCLNLHVDPVGIKSALKKSASKCTTLNYEPPSIGGSLPRFTLRSCLPWEPAVLAIWSCGKIRFKTPKNINQRSINKVNHIALGLQATIRIMFLGFYTLTRTKFCCVVCVNVCRNKEIWGKKDESDSVNCMWSTMQ